MGRAKSRQTRAVLAVHSKRFMTFSFVLEPLSSGCECEDSGQIGKSISFRESRQVPGHVAGAA
ncbi:MAG: hypothetical protein BWY17_04352 [Deltaproteobacteria bacterium ADurb.Bin207]|jgi:hypothetical protein|nr:MAG: hypothetical protein BWY17_04352 [Deltaproteobacteria bacterium ADurb.Bin207]